ncbi:hypothetical protein OM794_04585 [Halomonas sp. BDJS001]|uniref:hypothetical protein n=1 Tax=Halomonas sp. BDJS001 TaxID=2992143 RepID=UPI00223566ED|nr:hypothetical protein [Halomonas sp. BDJS001]UZH11038.1 hypothetical protein OM794_04585 [Halomonas sp. BDJS001]
MVFVARGKRQRTRSGGPARKQREAVPGLDSVPLGVVPPPFAGAYERSLNSRSRYHALRVPPSWIDGFCSAA